MAACSAKKKDTTTTTTTNNSPDLTKSIAYAQGKFNNNDKLFYMNSDLMSTKYGIEINESSNYQNGPLKDTAYFTYTSEIFDVYGKTQEGLDIARMAKTFVIEDEKNIKMDTFKSFFSIGKYGFISEKDKNGFLLTYSGYINGQDVSYSTINSSVSNDNYLEITSVLPTNYLGNMGVEVSGKINTKLYDKSGAVKMELNNIQFKYIFVSDNLVQ